MPVKPARTKAAAAASAGAFTALDLPPVPLDAETEAFFQKCRDKIGFVPNVLLAYTHDLAKLKAFSAMYNDLMLAPSGLSKLEREMIAVAVSSVNRCYYCLTAHGATVRQLSGDPELGEMLVMNYRAAGFSDRDIWDISATAAFYNMSNRMASATDMRPNAAYHGLAR